MSDVPAVKHLVSKERPFLVKLVELKAFLGMSAMYDADEVPLVRIKLHDFGMPLSLNVARSGKCVLTGTADQAMILRARRWAVPLLLRFRDLDQLHLIDHRAYKLHVRATRRRLEANPQFQLEDVPGDFGDAGAFQELIAMQRPIRPTAALGDG